MVVSNEEKKMFWNSLIVSFSDVQGFLLWIRQYVNFPPRFYVNISNGKFIHFHSKIRNENSLINSWKFLINSWLFLKFSDFQPSFSLDIERRRWKWKTLRLCKICLRNHSVYIMNHDEWMKLLASTKHLCNDAIGFAEKILNS